MPYTLAPRALSYTHPLVWPVPSWQQVLAGLPFLSPTLYIPAVSVLPSFTASVLLLDVAPSHLNVFIGAGITLVVGVVGWLLNRTISAFDNSVKETKEAVQVLSKVVGEIGKDQNASAKLQEYLEKRMDALEHEKKVLEKSFAEMDKLIAVKLNERAPK